jgi:hypothetical protein
LIDSRVELSLPSFQTNAPSAAMFTPDRQQRSKRPNRTPARPLVAAVSAIAAAVLAAAAPASAVHQELGELIVRQPCCSGAALQGARSHILFSNSPQVGNQRQVLSLVGAQDDVIQPGELGLTMDDNLVVDGDPSCYTPYNTVVGFYEWWDYVNTTVHCKNLGQTSVGHLYSVAQQSNNNFQFFVDGNPKLPSPLVEMRGSHRPNADQVAAGGEVVMADSVCCPEPVNWQASFGGNGNTPWQRFNNTLGWVTIQSNNFICNGPPGVCTGGGWSFSTGSFPTTWSVIH